MEEPLGADAAMALQFIDRRQGEWYCTACWAVAASIDPRVADRLAEHMATALEAVTAGYQARVGGPCYVCDAPRQPGAVSRKGLRSVRSLRTTT